MSWMLQASCQGVGQDTWGQGVSNIGTVQKPASDLLLCVVCLNMEEAPELLSLSLEAEVQHLDQKGNVGVDHSVIIVQGKTLSVPRFELGFSRNRSLRVSFHLDYTLSNHNLLEVTD
jgi:hypothetical protein